MTDLAEQTLSLHTSRNHSNPSGIHEKLDNRGHDNKSKKKWSKKRRVALGAATIAAVAGVGTGVGSQIIENGYYTREAIVKEIEESPIRYNDATTLAITGFNTSRTQTRLSAESMAPALDEIGAVGWIGYNDQGVDIDAMTAKTQHYLEENNYTNPGFMGGSMGGLTSLAIAANLADQGVTPRFIILDSTPATPDNIRNKSMAKLALQFNIPAVKGLAISTQSAIEGHRSALDIPGDWWQYTFHPGETEERSSSALDDAQFNYIEDFNLEDIAHRIPAETEIYYIGSGDRDMTIDTVAAHQKFSQVFDRDIPYIDTGALTDEVGGNMHASPIGHTDAYLAAIEPILKEHRIPPGNAAGGSVARYVK